MNRTWDQRSAGFDLGSYPHKIEVRGRPPSVTWPDVCANCAAGASERIRIRRAFYRRGRRRYSGFAGYRVVSAHVPFCGSCAARHRQTIPHRSWFQRYRWFVLNPAHIATIGMIWLLSVAWPSVRETPMDSSGGTVAWGLAGVLVAGIVWTIAITWWMSRPDRFEPPSEVTSACAISHNVGQFFEGPRHLYGFRNQAFADAFGRANERRVWTERDQAVMWRKSAFFTILLIVLVGGARLLLWIYEGK